MRLLGGWLLVALLAPSAGAAAASIAIEFGTPPALQPGSQVVIPGNVTFTGDAPSTDTTRVALRLGATPPWLLARVEPETLEASTAENGSARTPVRLLLTANASAAALERHVLQVTASADGEPSANATSSLTLRVAYAGRVRVEPANATVQARPGEPARITLEVTNEGNGAARVAFEAQPPAGVEALPPPTIVVEDAPRRVNLSLLAERAGRYAVPLKVLDSYAFDPAEAGPGHQLTLTFVVDAAGAPAPGVAAVALAALATAAARRCRR